jgi:hypothetical protein
MATLTEEEKAEVVANCDHLARLKFSPVLPRAFTEHGASMAANVLNSPRAAQMNYAIRIGVTPQQWTCAVAADGISVPSDLEGHRNGPGCPF